MAQTSNSYTGNGSTTNYSFTFPYLATTDIKAQLDGVVTTAFTLANATTVQFNSAPGNGVAIIIYRETDDTSLSGGEFFSGSSIRAETLNSNFNQTLYVGQEVASRSISSLGGTMQGQFALGKGINITFEGSTDDAHETTLTVQNPTADRTITLPNVTGTVVTTGDSGSVSTGMIADNNVTTAKILDGNVTTSKINDGAVTNVKLADDSVDSRNYVDNSIDTQHIANNQITSAKILDGNVLTSKINDGAVTTVKLANSSVTTAKINADAVDGTKIADDSINSEHYVADSIDTEHYAPNSVDVHALADNAVSRAKILADAVDGTKIADDSINSEHYVDASIDTAHIADSQITTAKLANDAVTNAKIGAGAISTDLLAADAVTNAKIADDSIDSEHYVDGSIDTDHIAGTAVTDVKLASNSVTESKITDANVTTNKLANDAVTIAKIGCEQTTISDSDSFIPTSGAVVDYVAAQLDPIGGLKVIADDQKFPNTQPASGVVISIADAGGLQVNSSGTSITGRTVGGSTVTINNIASNFNSSTVDAGVCFQVSSTGSGQVYNYHKATLKEADLLNLSNDINDFANRYRVFAGEPSSNNDEGDLVYDTNANKMKVYDTSTSAWKEVTSTGDFKYLFLCPAGGSGAPTINNTIATYDLREGSNSGSAASVTSAAQLIVSVNGVVQRANTGTSAPSEGFALVDANTIVFGANLQTNDSVFIVQIGSAVTIPTPGDGTVSAAKIASGAVETAKIADDAVTGDKIADNLDIPDNNKIRFGTGNDLSIFHNGNNSFIENQTGNLHLKGKTGEESIIAIPDAGVELYYNNVKTFETDPNGIKLLGPEGGDAEVNLFADEGDDNADKWRMQALASGGLNIQNFTSGSWETNFKANGNGAVELYHDNTKRAETYSNGFKVGNVTIDSTTGGSIFGADSSRGGVHFSPNAVLPSNSSGAVPDNAIALGSGSARWSSVYATTFYGDGSNLTGISSVGGANSVTFNDNVKVKLGTDQDMLLYHNDTDGQLANSKGNLILANSTDGEIFIDPKNNERGIVVKPDAGVELYHNNTKNFETVNGGVGIGINAQMNGSRCSIAQDGTHLSLRSFATGGYDSIIFRSANTTVGKVHFNSGGTQYHTSSDYRRKENIVDLTGAIDRVKTLQPKRFNFKTEKDVTRDGFLAHEVTAVPEAILGTKDQVATEKDVEEGKAEAVGDPIYQTIDQSALVPLLSAALKEAIAKIEVLETKVAALEAA